MQHSQILRVKPYEGCSKARAEYYRNDGNGWLLVCTCEAIIGKNGIGKTKESDGKTPCGEFLAVSAFGLLENPGITGLEYINIDENTYACDEPGEFYNKIVHHPCGGERMCEYSPAYDYGFVLDYNPQCIYPLGSAIFLHCKSGKGYTAGCVALDKELVRQLLVEYRTGLMVCIEG